MNMTMQPPGSSTPSVASGSSTLPSKCKKRKGVKDSPWTKKSCHGLDNSLSEENSQSSTQDTDDTIIPGSQVLSPEQGVEEGYFQFPVDDPELLGE